MQAAAAMRFQDPDTMCTLTEAFQAKLLDPHRAQPHLPTEHASTAPLLASAATSRALDPNLHLIRVHLRKPNPETLEPWNTRRLTPWQTAAPPAHQQTSGTGARWVSKQARRSRCRWDVGPRRQREFRCGTSVCYCQTVTHGARKANGRTGGPSPTDRSTRATWGRRPAGRGRGRLL